MALSKGVGGHLQQLDGVGVCMGMPRTSCGLGTDEEGETAEVEEPPEGDKVSTFPVLHV